MNLIEKLGLEKCKAIVEGAPSNAESYQDGYYFRESPEFQFHNGIHGQWNLTDNNGEYFKKRGFNPIRIEVIRAAIADHNKCQHEWNETTSNGDKYRFFVCKHCDSTQNYVPFKDDNPSHFDHCSDIKNHISPLTRVIEL